MRLNILSASKEPRNPFWDREKGEIFLSFFFFLGFDKLKKKKKKGEEKKMLFPKAGWC